MKMREYVDNIQGPGSWDAMHDKIDQMEVNGWTMPPVWVNGHKISIFPGTDREVTLEQVQDEIRKVLSAKPEDFEFIDGEDE